PRRGARPHFREVRPRGDGAGARREGNRARALPCGHAGSRASWAGGSGQHARRGEHVHHPAARLGPRPRHRRPAAVTVRGDGPMKRILIVEDEEGMLDGLAHNFRYEGYDVLTAKNGQEGLRMALKQKPDAVLLDIMLPEKDGFTVLKEL